jgi:hypothetical protein
MVERTVEKKTTTGGNYGGEREEKVEHSESTNPVTGKRTEKTVEKRTDY